MEKIILVYLIYIWVGVLHACFAGIALYSVWGKKIIERPKYIPVLILFLFLAFLEIYWIPIFKSLGLSLYTSSSEIQTHFNIDGQTNIVESLRPNFMLVGMWILETILAFWVGNWVYQKNCK